MKSTCVFWGFFSLFALDRQKNGQKVGGGEGNAGKDLRDLFQQSLLMSSLQHLTERDIFILQNSGQQSGLVYFIFLLRWVGELMYICGMRHQL